MEGTLRLRVTLALVLYAWGAPLAAQQPFTTRPEQAGLHVSDLHRLAAVLTSAERASEPELAARLDAHYLGEASPGLEAYAAAYGVTGATIASAVAANPGRYRELDALADALLAREPALRAAFEELAALHPGAVFPPVWFIVGDGGPGGLTREVGVLIAAEHFADTQEDVVPLVLHEVAHYNSALLQGVETYRRIYDSGGTLLALAIREGTAELVAELTTGRHINPEAERYGLENEGELWALFRSEMHGSETGDWMFARPSNPEWPPDLGYWIGYRIARTYYDRAADKTKAIVEILGVSDFDAFLEASGYDPRPRP